MSWLFSQALVEEYLGDTSLDGEQSAPLSGSNTQQAYCAPDKMTAFSRLSRFGMMYKPLTEGRGKELLTLYLEDSRARTSPRPEKAQELMENDQECGVKWRGSFTKYDPDMRLWKTHQCSLLGDLEPFLETWPQWGLMRDGECWEQRTLEQSIRGTESGSLLPTPDTVNRDNKKVLFNKNALSQSGRSLATYARTFPTPQARDWKDGKTSGNRKSPGLGVVAHQLAHPTSGQLNPTWVEWLMGWPLGWTDLKPLETDKSHCAQPQHGES
jgi:hypothetical protein